jgi:hypothetical protein
MSDQENRNPHRSAEARSSGAETHSPAESASATEAGGPDRTAQESAVGGQRNTTSRRKSRLRLQWI